LFIRGRTKGKKDPENLVTACRPCNVIKGHRIFRDFEHAKAYVLQRRDAFRKEWETRTARQQGKAATAEM
jgi:5-methylcytosine-specific restriction endonuclease McrA